MVGPAPESLTIDPSAGAWPGRVLGFIDRRASEASSARAALGLAIDRPLIMTGHQCTLWHMGIFAKYLACQSAAKSFDWAHAYIAVDHDPEHAESLRVPVLDGQWLASQVHRFFPAEESTRAPSLVPPMEVALPALRDGVRWATRDAEQATIEVVVALNAHSNAASRAAQITRAHMETLRDDLQPAPTIFASILGAHAQMKALIARMREDPESCVRAYNAAAVEHPSAGIRKLVAESSRGPELPLWRQSESSEWLPVFAADIRSDHVPALAPKALLMTAFLRMYACDLFVHGAGGGVYDRVTDQWIERWVPDVPLAPTVVVTATRYLALPTGTPRSSEDAARALARARWLAHHARHEPRVLNDTSAIAEKRGLLREIRETRRSGLSPASAFAALQKFLAAYRRRHASELLELQRRIMDIEQARGHPDPRTDRSWATILFSPEARRALRDEINRCFEQPSA